MMSPGQRLSSYLFLILVVVGGGVTLDALSSYGARREPAAEVAAGPRVPDRGRAFVFVIDSLRFQTAMNPALMPRLSALRETSTFARVTPSNDAVTVPSIREAFTGEERTRLLGFVSNFLKRRAGVRSVFTDLASQGRRAVAFSDDAFTQFGEDAVESRSNGDDGPTEVRDQNAAIGTALEVYASAREDLVVMHITYTDHVAHEDGIAGDRYRERFLSADGEVGAIARAVPETDTLVVMGDHGHDEKGRHAFGLDVPTFALYRGPRFRRGFDLGVVPIRDHRYLLGYALGLPLPDEYDGGRPAEALTPTGTTPSDYAPVVQAANGPDAAATAARRRAYVATAVDLALAFAVWLVVAGPFAVSAVVPAGARALAWASTVPRFVAEGSIAGLVCGAVASALCLVWVLALRRRARGRWGSDSEGSVASAGAAVVLGLGFAGLGFWFPVIRPRLHEPTYESLVVLWLSVWAVAAVVSWTARSVVHGRWLVGLPLFAFFPTVYRYGAPAAMAPAAVGFLLCVFAAARGRPAEALRSPLRGATWATAALPILLLVPFLAVDASDYRFGEWVIYPSDWNPAVWILGAAVAKALILLRREQTRPVRVAALCLATLMVFFEQVRASRIEEPLSIAILGYALVAALHRRHENTRAAQAAPDGAIGGAGARLRSPSEELALVSGLLLAHHAFTRADFEAYFWRDWLLAAVFLSGRAVREFVPPDARRTAHAALLFLSLLVTAWVTFAWTVHRLEWAFLYEWFRAPFVEKHVGFFLPLILARYLLPLVAARLLLAQVFGRREPYPGRAVQLLAGAKIASLFLVTAGIGYTSPTTEIYLEGAEETAILGVLSAGLL